jgi:hypothetical protein
MTDDTIAKAALMQIRKQDKRALLVEKVAVRMSPADICSIRVKNDTKKDRAEAQSLDLVIELTSD